jgi:membrane associated rhomboid family serine protease
MSGGTGDDATAVDGETSPGGGHDTGTEGGHDTVIGSEGGASPVPTELRETPATFALLTVFLVVFLGTRVAEARFGTDLYRAAAVEFRHLADVPTWVSASFLHGNRVHLLLNSAFLLFFGRSVERHYGSGPLVAVFLLVGVANAVLGTAFAAVNRCGLDAFRATTDCIAAGGGSSIALFGLVGFVTRHRPRAPLTLLPGVRVPLWGFTGGFLVVSVLGMYTPVDPLRTLLGFWPGHPYHFVGILLGLALGSVWRPDE